MSPPCLTELMPLLTHPEVRDLAWVLLSPPLLQDVPAPQRHPLAASRWLDNPDELGDWLLSHDAQPGVLRDWLAQHSIRRLGLYYERLWQFALSQAPDVNLLATNLPIRAGGRTLGELDLVLQDAEGVHHLEFAVKFYLGLEDGDRSRHDWWLGPGSRDRLDIKLRHLCEHQLKLSSSVPADLLLRELTSREVSSALWLGGYLFQPWPFGCELPAGAYRGQRPGRWLRRRDWAGLASVAGEARWQPLPRQRWLAPAQLDATLLSPTEEVERWVAEINAKQARLLVRLEPAPNNRWIEQERLFVVPDQWPA